MTQRVPLTPDDVRRLQAAAHEAQNANAAYRALCLEMVEKTSLRVVGQATGIAPTTLQRWKLQASSN